MASLSVALGGADHRTRKERTRRERKCEHDAGTRGGGPGTGGYSDRTVFIPTRTVLILTFRSCVAKTEARDYQKNA